MVGSDASFPKHWSLFRGRISFIFGGLTVRMKLNRQASSAEQDYVAAKLEAEHREEIARKAIEDAAAKVGLWEDSWEDLEVCIGN